MQSIVQSIEEMYFAYGSNLSIRRLRTRVPSARFLGVFHLPEHVMKFHKIGGDGSAKCNALFTGRESDTVPGAVFRVHCSEIHLLDSAEGLGHGYAKHIVTLQNESGVEIQAFTYTAVDIDDTLKPFTWYKFHVLTGAEEVRLDPVYIQAIRSVEAVPDPDVQRAKRELAIYGLSSVQPMVG